MANKHTNIPRYTSSLLELKNIIKYSKTRLSGILLFDKHYYYSNESINLISNVTIFNNCIFIEIQLSAFEADLTNLEVEDTNKILSMFSTWSLVVTSIFMAATQAYIKYFFKMNKSVVKPKMKNVVSSKILLIILGLFSILGAYGLLDTHFRSYIDHEKLAHSSPYIMGIVGNLILVTYLGSNVEAITYWRLRIKSWKDQYNLRKERKEIKKRMNQLVFADMVVKHVVGVDTDLPRREEEIYVLDIE
jgi:hypothetical protein